MFDPTGWELVCTFGWTGLIFAKGSRRVLINKHTCAVIIEYDFN